MADALRNNMDAAEYKHVVLGLPFLKYISDAFEAKHREFDGSGSVGGWVHIGGHSVVIASIRLGRTSNDRHSGRYTRASAGFSVLARRRLFAGTASWRSVDHLRPFDTGLD